MNQTRYISAILAAGLASVATANAREFVMSLQPAEGQRAWVDKGAEVIDSAGPHTVVRFFEAEGLLGKRAQIMVYVLNEGDSSFNFAPEDISAVLEDGTALPIIKYERLAAEERKERKRRAFAAALGAMGNSLSASQAGYSYGTATATAFGPAGTAHAYGTYSGYDATASALAQQNAQRENQMLLANKNAKDAAGRAALQMAYQISTVPPKEVKGGPITIELPKAVRSAKTPTVATFTVSVGGDTHTIRALFTPTM